MYKGVIFLKDKLKAYIISIVIPLVIGGISAMLTFNNMNIYGEIEKPFLSPPAILFPIVWTILYILMGISSAIIKLSDNENKADALIIYRFSLLINFFWSIIFFNMRAYNFAFVWLIALWLFVFYTIIKYSKINKTAAYLQIPYLLWITFAGYLNLMISILN